MACRFARSFRSVNGLPDRLHVGLLVATLVATLVGALVGAHVGALGSVFVGEFVGSLRDGWPDGLHIGLRVTALITTLVGALLGVLLGTLVGARRCARQRVLRRLPHCLARSFRSSPPYPPSRSLLPLVSGLRDRLLVGSLVIVFVGALLSGLPGSLPVSSLFVSLVA
jgi:hypothetical protein